MGIWQRLKTKETQEIQSNKVRRFCGLCSSQVSSGLKEVFESASAVEARGASEDTSSFFAPVFYLSGDFCEVG